MKTLRAERRLLVLVLVAGGAGQAVAQSVWHMTAPDPNQTNPLVGGEAIVSGDGRHAVGSATIGRPYSPGYIWSVERGDNNAQGVFFNSIGLGVQDHITGVSYDGSVVAGYSSISGMSMYAYGTGSGSVYRPLGQSGSFALPTGVSGSGDLVAGYQYATSGAPSSAVYWSGTDSAATLSTPTPSTSSVARGVSRDGSTIVGDSQNGSTSSPHTAISWHNGVGTALPGLAGSSSNGGDIALGADGDGSVIVGMSGLFPVRWQNGAVARLLGPGGVAIQGKARAVSDDGNVIVGEFAFPGRGTIGGIWTPQTALIPLGDYLLANGFSANQLSTISTVASVSADGRTFGARDSTSGVVYALVPSPGAGALLSLGMLASMRRRRD